MKLCHHLRPGSLNALLTHEFKDLLRHPTSNLELFLQPARKGWGTAEEQQQLVLAESFGSALPEKPCQWLPSSREQFWHFITTSQHLLQIARLQTAATALTDLRSGV